MNLYEWEGKELLKRHGIAVPHSILVRRGDDAGTAYRNLGTAHVVVKAQILSGKRGENHGIIFSSNEADTVRAVKKLFSTTIRGQYVASVLVEEKLAIRQEHYVSITYDTLSKRPVLVYSGNGGVRIEDVPDNVIEKKPLDIRQASCNSSVPYAQQLWQSFLKEDARVAEINPLIETRDGRFIAADAKFALDDDAFYRHENWATYEPRTMLGRPPTEREIAIQEVDAGAGYYRGTAGKYIEMEGDIAILFSGGGASIANMDALIKAGLKPANYTEYSGNPPREKVYQLTKIVLSKPGLRGLWIAGGVANFTDIAETFGGIVDALDEMKPAYPIVVRRAGPNEEEGKRLMRECAVRNHLHIKIFGKETSMSKTAHVLAGMVGATA